jgi:hypothetical protein
MILVGFTAFVPEWLDFKGIIFAEKINQTHVENVTEPLFEFSTD